MTHFSSSCSILSKSVQIPNFWLAVLPYFLLTGTSWYWWSVSWHILVNHWMTGPLTDWPTNTLLHTASSQRISTTAIVSRQMASFYLQWEDPYVPLKDNAPHHTSLRPMSISPSIGERVRTFCWAIVQEGSHLPSASVTNGVLRTVTNDMEEKYIESDSLIILQGKATASGKGYQNLQDLQKCLLDSSTAL